MIKLFCHYATCLCMAQENWRNGTQAQNIQLYKSKYVYIILWSSVY